MYKNEGKKSGKEYLSDVKDHFVFFESLTVNFPYFRFRRQKQHLFHLCIVFCLLNPPSRPLVCHFSRAVSYQTGVQPCDVFLEGAHAFVLFLEPWLNFCLPKRLLLA